MVESSSPTSSSQFIILDYIGKPIQELKESRAFQRPPKSIQKGALQTQVIEPCEFEEVNTKSGNPKGTFHTCKEKGFQAFTIDGSPNIDFITLYNTQADKFRQYPYQLPYGLSLGHNNQDVVRRFGDTKDKGGGSLPIWLRYEHIGIEITFQNKDWNDTANPITYVKLFKRTKIQEECAICLRSFKTLKAGSEKLKVVKCRGCQIAFCPVTKETNCYQEFEKVHKDFCFGESVTSLTKENSM